MKQHANPYTLNWKDNRRIQRITTYQTRKPSADVTGNSNKVGKPKLYLAICWRLSVDKSES